MRSGSSCRLRLPAPSKDASRSLDQYQVSKKLHRGETSMVLKAVDRRTGAHVVLKVYSKRLMEELDRGQLEREMEIHSRLSHDNIIDLITVFEDELAVYLVQSYAPGGDLFSALHAAGRFDESRAAGDIIAPLLSALDYIHFKGVIHRDIKIENLLLDLHGKLKLADFGLAIDCNDTRPRSRLGTWEYMAPEIHLCPFKGTQMYTDDDSATYSTAVDVWAVGVLAYELLVGTAPFQQEAGSIGGLSYESVMSSDLTFPDFVSPDACSFIRSALCKQPRGRPSARQLQRHRWLRPFVKVDVGDGECAAALPQPSAQGKRGERGERLSGSKSLPLHVLSKRVLPAPAGAYTGEGQVQVCQSPTSSVKAPLAPTRLQAASPAPARPSSPARPPEASSPSSTTSSTRHGHSGQHALSGSHAVPAASSGALATMAAATAGMLRRLPSRIQSLLVLSDRTQNQVWPSLPASSPVSLSQRRTTELDPLRDCVSAELAKLPALQSLQSDSQSMRRPGTGGTATAYAAWTRPCSSLDHNAGQYSTPNGQYSIGQYITPSGQYSTGQHGTPSGQYSIGQYGTPSGQYSTGGNAFRSDPLPSVGSGWKGGSLGSPSGRSARHSAETLTQSYLQSTPELAARRGPLGVGLLLGSPDMGGTWELGSADRGGSGAVPRGVQLGAAPMDLNRRPCLLSESSASLFTPNYKPAGTPDPRPLVLTDSGKQRQQLQPGHVRPATCDNSAALRLLASGTQPSP